MNFRSESDIDHFIASFKAGTLPSYCWTHAAHLGMCAAHLWSEDVNTTADIRKGIQNYLEAQGMPASAYHETLTLFWIDTVRGYLHESKPESRLAAVCGVIKALGRNSDLPGKRYTFDVFNSSEAMARWIPPDA